MKRPTLVVLVLGVLAILGTLGSKSGSDQQQKGVAEQFPNREAMVSIISNLRRIHTPEGIEVLEQIEIAGVKHWVSIRGRNKNNPVLMLIHGGPGFPMMPFAWTFQNPWEDYFTVVEYDQRGVGKNYQSADHNALARTVSLNRLSKDAEELVGYLRQRLHKDKVVVLGFSYGTCIGVHLAKSKPEWISAYVGVGQSVSPEDERVLYEGTLARAKRAKNAEAIKELEAMAPYPLPEPEKTPFQSAINVRKWARVYNGGWYGKPDFKILEELPAFAPEYTVNDIQNIDAGEQWVDPLMQKDFFTDDLRRLGPDYKCPMIFLIGRYDLHTPYATAKAFAEGLNAPAKKFITFERSSHFVMFEEPGRFLVTLVKEVLPLTEGAAEYKPEL